jgi:hypothetical protein
MQTHLPRTSRHILAVIASVLLGAALWTGQAALAQEANWTGLVEVMPAGGGAGQWTVGGRTFAADAATELRQDKGPLAVGVCAEVEYVGTVAPFQATKIASKSADNCAAPPTGTPSETPTATPSETPTPPALEREAYGTVTAMPAPGFVGNWIVGGVTYAAPAGTEFKQEAGPLLPGACVKVHYRDTTTPFTAREIETRVASDCDGGATPDPSATPAPTATPTDEVELYGRVDSLPAGLVGPWTIAGVAYNATAATEFDQEDGPFAVGVCVKLDARTSTAPATLEEVETERDYRCGGPGSGAPGGVAGEGELYGLLQSFPTGFIGTWNIAGMSFVVTTTTELDQDAGPFVVGNTVKVHFTTGAGGVNLAREIETKLANDSDGSDDDGNGAFEGAEGHAYGVIDSMPANQAGVWVISGIGYTATAATRFEQNDGALALGARVKVEYFLNAAGGRTADKIETTNNDGEVEAPGHARFFGFVRLMPANGLMGDWTVDDANFVAGPTARFKEEHGLLGLGAFVAVEYAVVNGVNQVHELETHVPPGAGPLAGIGTIDDKGGTLAAASTRATTWVVGGVSYAVTPATDLNDVQGALAVGSTAVVNSYPAGDGSRIATQIRGVTLGERVFLPAVVR